MGDNPDYSHHMDPSAPSFELQLSSQGTALLRLAGDWSLQKPYPAFADLARQTLGPLSCETAQLGTGDSS